MKTGEIIEKLKGDGARITRTRREIINIFTKYAVPLTAKQLLGKLAKRKLSVNKTTVYRELDFLAGKGFLREIILADGEVRYEAAGTEHYHHLFCVKCKKIDAVKLAESACVAATNPPVRGFKVLGHSIEMFGICSKCQKPKNHDR